MGEGEPDPGQTVFLMALDHHQERTRRPISSLIADITEPALTDAHAALWELGIQPPNWCRCAACLTAICCAGTG
jgi:hypothetical protein